ncbi:hypothetical protein HYPSUDRAFT_173561 [Hypholoma sublateritium FD-334 SS-4]|uniref:G-alpha-domain-containing protein n=1 Tax=Hypholoma sublateritium (strain FD-334 SS-4) TaxID=945553 RepID=A0A0D2N528_HYPSF|nr:hypothetical protein HYPSUDRAFT_173561 [Hypholoma sublateritium FD-334 SS-4]
MKSTKSSEPRTAEVVHARSAVSMIDIQLEKDRQARADNMLDILLLEPEGSNTAADMLRQVSLLQNGGFSLSERSASTGTVFHRVLEEMRSVLEAAARLPLSLQEENLVHGNLILSVNGPSFSNEVLPPNVSNALRSLVRDSAVSETLDRAKESQLKPMDADSARYFFSAIERITDPAYLPSDQDILRGRKDTHGNQAAIFKMGELTYRMCNMSGQWHGWRKWIHHFQGMKALLFLVDLGRYNYSLEESTSNYIEDAIDMFDVLCNVGPFKETSKIIFFITDEFAEKLPYVPLNSCFPDYSGHSYDDACEYFLNRFLSVRNSESKIQIYAHFTNKTDMVQVKFMLSAVQDILLQAYLREHNPESRR